MKKIMMMVAMLAVSFAMQAQTKFHDVELNEAKGAVKCIKSNRMGQDIVINFTQDGKMSQQGMSDAKYDAEGYLQSAKMSMMGNEIEVTYKWENGRVVSQNKGRHHGHGWQQDGVALHELQVRRQGQLDQPLGRDDGPDDGADTHHRVLRVSRTHNTILHIRFIS